MAIVVFDPDEVIDYIPKQERNSDNPCVIKMKYVPYGKVGKYANIIAQKSRGKLPDGVLEVQHEVQKQQFCDNVVEVENFFVGTKPVKDPSDFYELAPATLIYEIIGAMESHARLSEGQRKNLSGDSDGASPQQKPDPPSNAKVVRI